MGQGAVEPELWWWLLAGVGQELALFAAIGFLLGGLDDLAVDLIWIGRTLWRRAAVYTRFEPADAQTLAPPEKPGRIAIFVPAWDESAVIGQMLTSARARLEHGDYRIFVGVYPNDPRTMAIVGGMAAHDPRVRMVVNPRPGSTTKADCLNRIWEKMLADEAATGARYKAVVLHDAEDVVHPAELRIFDRLIERFDLVQLPVLPLIDRRSRWIAGSYADAFAEAHGKQLVVREAIGASIPSAGVGCAFSRDALQRIADARGGELFDEASLTEDYELGLRIHDAGGRSAFVRLPVNAEGGIVAIREHFPAGFHAAVVQKSRWIVGIALAGWDRLGWAGGFAEFWMRLRDRRAVLSAVVLFAGYAAMLIYLALASYGAFFHTPPIFSPLVERLAALSLLLVGWRAAVRVFFVHRAYGRQEAWRAPIRLVVGNFIDIFACFRAVKLYVGMRRTGQVRWEKTSHVFPEIVPAE